VAREMAVPEMAIVAGCEMRDVQVSLREPTAYRPTFRSPRRCPACRRRPGRAPLRPEHATTVWASVGVAPSKRFDHLRDEHHAQPLMAQFPGILPRAKSIASDGIGSVLRKMRN
jgi:hypothetical protein